MKKILLLLAVAMLSIATVMADDDKAPVPYKKLPDLGKRTIASYFPQAEVVTTMKSTDKGQKNRYHVVLTDKTEIEFDKDGNWLDVECVDSTVPSRMVSGMIRMYLDQNYNGAQVVKMERESKTDDIKVKLDNGTKLKFTRDFKFIGVDD